MTHNERLLFGARLRARRNDAGYTQETVAEKIGISPRYYQMLERGEKNVSLKTLIKLSRLLSASTDYLLFGDVPSPADNPFSLLYQDLTPAQREDAAELLRIYARACLR